MAARQSSSHVLDPSIRPLGSSGKLINGGEESVSSGEEDCILGSSSACMVLRIAAIGLLQKGQLIKNS